MSDIWRNSSEARASGSYPAGHRFKSHFRHHKWPVGPAVKTRPFHGCNMGSIPVRVTKNKRTPISVSFLFLIILTDNASTLQACLDWGRIVCPVVPCRNLVRQGIFPYKFSIAPCLAKICFVRSSTGSQQMLRMSLPIKYGSPQIFVSSLLNENLLVRTRLIERYILHFRPRPMSACKHKVGQK